MSASASGGRALMSRALGHAHVADRVALPVDATGHAVRRVALDRLDAAVGLDGLDDADVLVPDDEIARLRVLAGGRGDGAAALLRPRVQRVDRAEALAVVADGDAGLAGEPRDEVGAPRARGRGARGGGGGLGGGGGVFW